MVLRWRYVVLSMEQSRNNYVINVCFTSKTYLLMAFWLLPHRKNNIATLWRTWVIIVLGKLSLCCWAFAWLNDCINGDEADVTFVQTRKTQSLYLHQCTLPQIFLARNLSKTVCWSIIQLFLSLKNKAEPNCGQPMLSKRQK